MGRFVMEVVVGWESDLALRLHLGVYKEIEWNDHKGMEWNGMYLSKGKE